MGVLGRGTGDVGVSRLVGVVDPLDPRPPLELAYKLNGANSCTVCTQQADLAYECRFSPAAGYSLRSIRL